MIEKVGKAMANFIGTFVEYDKNNNSSFLRQYMRLSLKIDVCSPLKKDTKVRTKGGEWCTVNFKYEKLSIFCFVCGILGHTEYRCAIRFEMEEDTRFRGWSPKIRVENKRFGGGTSRLLKEEEGGSRQNNVDSGFSQAREMQSPQGGRVNVDVS